MAPAIEVVSTSHEEYREKDTRDKVRIYEQVGVAEGTIRPTFKASLSRGGGRRQGDRGASGAITATELDTGDTSEFSDCVVVLGWEAPVQENPTLLASDLQVPRAPTVA